jgi:autophagy-related protein 2
MASFLPNLSFSLPSLSLPTSIQNKLVSYLLKRFLGSVIKGGEIDLEKVEMDLKNGRVEIRDVEVESEVWRV